MPPAPDDDPLPPRDPRRPPEPAPGLDPALVVEPARRRLVLTPGLRYMALGAFFFSLMSLFVKVAGQRLPTQEIVLARALITLALSWVTIRWMVRPKSLGTNRRLLVARGVVGYASLSAVYYAYIHLPLAEATVLQYLSPVFTALIAAVWLKERLAPLDLTLAAVSLGGVVFVAQPRFLFGGLGEPLPLLAVLVALSAAVFSAIAYNMTRKLRETEDPMVIVFWFAAISVVLALPFGFVGALWPTPFEWLVLLGVGVTTQLAQVCLTKGLHAETAGRATAISYVQIVFAAIWGALFLGVYPNAGTVVGAGIILACALLLVRRVAKDREDARRRSPEPR